MTLARQNLLHFELIIHQAKMQLGQKECDGDIHSQFFSGENRILWQGNSKWRRMDGQTDHQTF